MSFSLDMRKVVLDLATELGNSCTLTHVIRQTDGGYDPLTGETNELITTDYHTFSVPANKTTLAFGQDGQNTNLAAFDTNAVLVPWVGTALDETWRYNGQNITSVSPIESQDLIIGYNISVGEKR